MFPAYYFLVFSHIFGIALLFYGWLLHRNTNPEVKLRWLRWLYWPAGVLVQLGAILFPLINLGRNIAIAKFNMMGLDLILIGAVLAALGGLISWLTRRRFHPGATLLIASGLQVVIVYIVKFYYSRV